MPTRRRSKKRREDYEQTHTIDEYARKPRPSIKLVESKPKKEIILKKSKPEIVLKETKSKKTD